MKNQGLFLLLFHQSIETISIFFHQTKTISEIDRYINSETQMESWVLHERFWKVMTSKKCKNRSNFTYRKKAIISDRWVDFKTFLRCQIFTANVRKENNKMHEWLIMRQSRNFEIPPWTTTQSWSCGLLVRQWKVSEGKFIQFPKSNYFFMIRIEMKLDQRIESDFSYQWAFTFCVSILYLI